MRCLLAHSDSSMHHVSHTIASMTPLKAQVTQKTQTFSTNVFGLATFPVPVQRNAGQADFPTSIFNHATPYPANSGHPTPPSYHR